jgi:hypothetical protein
MVKHIGGVRQGTEEDLEMERSTSALNVEILAEDPVRFGAQVILKLL